ncbi:hypothetical protein [Coraliomargarita akajimensis]|uniref:Uncharacterized protein n=1 Tax=Coraliomargarita akajimensis (strain DSM 45221 / IAM 15411 / JCM 23193 / KCTC 12865 / 04OKA010-24) TaxID=583355 RepID=D5EMD5_CORAD|nr:hypothetical protein [Coraliomargarita akajimensis]ADE53341.1 hypothetical protein Caka_0316 [Coraliomargarita akajimensis DSM 45221]
MKILITTFLALLTSCVIFAVEKPDDVVLITWTMKAQDSQVTEKEFTVHLASLAFEIKEKSNEEKTLLAAGKFQNKGGYIWIDQTIQGMKVAWPKSYISAKEPRVMHFNNQAYRLVKPIRTLSSGEVLAEGQPIDPFEKNN